MKINEQYHNLNLLENVTYEFLGRDGETHEETEPILVEHMMDVYVNERLTMKLVCIPQHQTELDLGRLFTEGILSSAEDVEQIYICEFGKRARVILSKNKSGQSHEENEDYAYKLFLKLKDKNYKGGTETIYEYAKEMGVEKIIDRYKK